MSTDTGIIRLFDVEKYGKPSICKNCYDDLLNGIPDGVRNTPSRKIWEAIVEYVHLKIRQDHLSDS